MSDPKKSLSFHAILLSLFGFVLLWAAVSDAWGYSSHLPLRHGQYLYAYLSRLIWVAPAVWLIVRNGAHLRFPKETLFSRPARDPFFILVLAASLLLPLGQMLVVHGGLWLDPSVVPPLEILKFVMVGFVEETVFRGWGYNALSAVTTDKKAMLCSTAFFVLLHWPAYFIRLFRFGTMDLPSLLMQSLTVSIWGFVCCRLLKRGNSLWGPIIAHTVYDVFTVLFVG